MLAKAKKETKTYGIVGLGRFGYALAAELARSGAELLVIDQDEEKVRQMRELTDHAYVVHTLDKQSLADTGIQNCDVAVVCVGEQMDTSILTTLNLVSMGIPAVIAKATSAEHGEILEKLGAQVVYPERDMAIRLAHRFEASKVLDFIQLSERLDISKLLLPEKAVGKTVRQLDLRGRFGMNIIALERASGALLEDVSPDCVLNRNDILFVVGNTEGMNRLSDWSNQE